MSRSKKAAKSVLMIIAFTLSSKVLGFIREMLIAAKFGSGVETDTFFIALTAVTLFTAIITKVVNTTTIPVLAEIEAAEGKKGKKEHTNNLLNIILGASLFIILLAWILAPAILRLLAYGFKGDQFKLAVLMMRLGLPAILITSIIGVLRSYLQSESMFTETAATGFPFNFVYITFLVFLSGIFGIKGLMVTSVLATMAQMVIQVPGVKKTGFKYRFVLDLKDTYIKKIAVLIPPLLISVIASDLNRMIDRSLASTLVKGSISALSYAGKLEGLIKGVFISAIITVMYPMLSKEANRGSYDELKRVIVYGINVILLITIPATAGIIILVNPIVKAAFERGAFDSVATYMTAGALVFYSIGMVGAAVKSILVRVYYSLQDTKTPMLNGIIAVIINVVFNLLLIGSMAHRGLALATSISAISTSLLLLYDLRKKIGPFGFAQSVKCALKSLAATAVMGASVYSLYGILSKRMAEGPLSELIVLVVSAGTGVLIYSAIIYSLKIKEIHWLIRAVKQKIRQVQRG